MVARPAGDKELLGEVWGISVPPSSLLLCGFLWKYALDALGSQDGTGIKRSIL